MKNFASFHYTLSVLIEDLATKFLTLQEKYVSTIFPSFPPHDIGYPHTLKSLSFAIW